MKDSPPDYRAVVPKRVRGKYPYWLWQADAVIDGTLWHVAQASEYGDDSERAIFLHQLQTSYEERVAERNARWAEGTAD